MKLMDLFRQLSYGELSNLSISGEGSGTLVEAKHPQLIGYTNEALLRLFSRFVLSERDLVIETVPHITTYHLRRKYAESANACDVPYPYIKDLAGEPFEEDVLKIIEVRDSHGWSYTLNDRNDPDSLFTPQPDMLQIPYPREGAAIAITYQARHPVLRDKKLREAENLLDQHIDLPFFLEAALRALIATSVFSHMGGQENTAKGQEFYALAEVICTDVEQRDLVSQTTSTTNLKLEQRGFV